MEVNMSVRGKDSLLLDHKEVAELNDERNFWSSTAGEHTEIHVVPDASLPLSVIHC